MLVSASGWVDGSVYAARVTEFDDNGELAREFAHVDRHVCKNQIA